MRIARIERHTHRLVAPTDWREEESGRCGTLFVRQEEMSGVPFMRSAWEAEPNEALALAAGAKMILGIAGIIDPPRRSHPVVNVSIETIPDDFEPVLLATPIVAGNCQTGVQVDILYANHGNPRRGMCQVLLEGRGFAGAVAFGIEEIDAMARREGWIE